MMDSHFLTVSSRAEFRTWLEQNHRQADFCWIVVKRGCPKDDKIFYYLDAVEEALCFGWIDSIWKNINGVMWSRFSPRRSKSHWTELNKERVRRLEKLGLMTDAGRAVLPCDMNSAKFIIDDDILQEFQIAGVLEQFQTFPPLYQRVRLSNLVFYKQRHPQAYQTMLANTITKTKQNKTYGEWNDYGRLLNY